MFNFKENENPCIFCNVPLSFKPLPEIHESYYHKICSCSASYHKMPPEDIIYKTILIIYQPKLIKIHVNNYLLRIVYGDILNEDDIFELRKLCLL